MNRQMAGGGCSGVSILQRRALNALFRLWLSVTVTFIPTHSFFSYMGENIEKENEIKNPKQNNGCIVYSLAS
jgi:hypothetical protein